MTKHPTAVLGLDGGGSNTRVVILNENGTVLGEGRGGPANIRAVDVKIAQTSLNDAIQQALDSANISPNQLSAANWALAGAGRAAAIAIYQSIARELLPSVKTSIVKDAEATLMGALGSRRGLIIIAGTGMIAYGEDGRGNSVRAGGWGTHLDEGSGYALGIAALRAVAAEADGTGLATDLTSKVRTYLNIDESIQLVPWLYDPQRKPSDVAALAPLVLDAAEAGDSVATNLVARAADSLADTAVAAYRKLQQKDERLPISYGGSLIEKSSFYYGIVDQAIRTRLPEASLQPPLEKSVIGSAALALAELGITLLQPTKAPVSGKSNLRSSEQQNCLTMKIDLCTSLEIAGAMHLADQQAVASVGSQLTTIASVIDAIVPRMEQGGRLIYVGSGTSGRLGILDASECPPTFNASPEQVIGLVAGGTSAEKRPQKGAEDSATDGARAVLDLSIQPNDTVVGIAASGRTPYVIGALEAARKAKALTVAVTCNLPAPIAQPAQYTIAPLVGPEVITGSTRLKAGTAQKLVLNMLSTGIMIRLGKTYGNLMVDVQQMNKKLEKRAQRIVSQACNLSADAAAAHLQQAQGDVKTAIVMQLLDCSVDEARQNTVPATPTG